MPPGERLAALESLLEASVSVVGGEPSRPLPRLAVLFVTAQLKVWDCGVLYITWHSRLVLSTPMLCNFGMCHLALRVEMTLCKSVSL